MNTTPAGGDTTSRALIEPSHLSYLTERGLPLAYALTNDVHSVTAAEAEQLTGSHTTVGGLAFPYPEADYVHVRLFGDARRKCLAPRRPVPVFVPKGVLERLRRWEVAVLVVVESPLKALVLAQHGVDAVGLAGISTTLDGDGLNASWNLIPWAAIDEVKLLPDSNVGDKLAVAHAVARLSAAFQPRVPRVTVARLPQLHRGKTTGPDDFVANMGMEKLNGILADAHSANPIARATVSTASADLEALLDDPLFLVSIVESPATERAVKTLYRDKKLSSALTQALKAVERRGSERRHSVAEHYCVREGRHCRWVKGEAQPLCNFVAEITRETVVDDGNARQVRVTIRGTLDTGRPLPEAVIPLEELSSRNWPRDKWGADVMLHAGPGITDAVTAAIQANSRFERETRYAHTGWRLHDGDLVYLHGGGAVGSDSLRTELDGVLGRTRLPDCVVDPAIALRWALYVQHVAPQRISLVLLAAAFRAPTLEFLAFDGTIALVGTSGARKTSLAMLVASFWGLTTHADVISFSSTAASVEHALYMGKDMIVVLDDYVPDADPRGAERRKVELAIRSTANRAPRVRMRADMTQRPVLPARGLALCTAEDLDLTRSVVARTLVLPVAPGDVNLDVLTRLQGAGTHLSEAMAAYVSWLSGRAALLRERLPKLHAIWRDHFAALTHHSRTASIAAHVMLGAELLAEFAVEIGATHDPAPLITESRLAIAEAIGSCDEALVAQDPVERFLDTLRSLVVSGDAILDQASATEGTPSKHVGFKWRGVAYLDSDAAFPMVQSRLTDAGSKLAVSPTKLWKLMDEKGLLAAKEPGRLKTRVPTRQTSGTTRHVAVALSLIEES